jgi:hypothetical protein
MRGADVWNSQVDAAVGIVCSGASPPTVPSQSRPATSGLLPSLALATPCDHGARSTLSRTRAASRAAGSRWVRMGSDGSSASRTNLTNTRSRCQRSRSPRAPFMDKKGPSTSFLPSLLPPFPRVGGGEAPFSFMRASSTMDSGFKRSRADGNDWAVSAARFVHITALQAQTLAIRTEKIS